MLCISLFASKKQIQTLNKGTYVEFAGEHYYVLYGDVFYAKIEKIEETNGNTYIYVKELEINDINHRGEFYFRVDNDTELSCRGSKKSVSDLKEGQTVSITSAGMVEEWTGKLTKVARVIILN